MNQEESVLAWLKEGKMINKTIAFDELAIPNLGTKIFRLRDEGHDIESVVKPCEKTGKKMAHYTLSHYRR